MTAPISPVSWLTLLRGHVEAAMIGGCILLIVAAIVFAYEIGGRDRERTVKIAALEAYQDTLHVHEVKERAVVSALDSTRTQLKTATDSVDSLRALRHRESATRVTAAMLVRAGATISGDTVTIASDTGAEHYTVPVRVIDQWQLERAADAAALEAYRREVVTDSVVIAGKDAQLQNDARDFAARDTLDATMRESLQAARAEIAEYKKQTAPRFSFTEGTAVGAGVVVVVRVVFAFLTHH